jgi:4-amino-4-deoxy-L-arabinose transferase-like glycosyltransferase
MKQERKKDLIWLLSIFLFFVLLRLPTLYEPFGRDQGIFATIASGLLEGKIPYRDLWDHKPPAIYFVYALAFKLLGSEMRSIPLFDGFYTILSLLLLFKLAKDLFGRKSAYLAIFLFTILSSGIFFLGWWGRGQPEVFILLPLLGMIHFLKPVELKEKPSFSLVLAGILGGIAFSFKSTIFPLLFLFSFLLLFEGGMGSKGIRKGIIKILLFFLGVIIALLPFVIFFSINRVLNDAIYSNVTFNLTTHINHPFNLAFLHKLKGNFKNIGGEIPLLWLTVLILALYGLFRIAKDEKEKRLLLIVWSIGTLLSICIGWWLFYYHFIILIPPLTLIASYGFFQLLDRISSQGSRMHQITKRLLYFFFIPLFSLEFLYAYFNYYGNTEIIPALIGVEKVSREDIYSRFKVQEFPIEDFSFCDDYRLSRYLKSHTQKGEKIFIWGWESLVYFLSEREPASRFIFIYPLIQSEYDTRNNLQKILLVELKNERPHYFVVTKKDQNPIDRIGSEKRLSSFPEIEELLKRNYLKEKETERFTIYRRIT